MWIRSMILVAAMSSASLANEAQWTLSGPSEVAAGTPMTWSASVAVTGNNQGLAGYAISIAVGPFPGPEPGADGIWGTADDENLIPVTLPAAHWEVSFQPAGAPAPGTIKDPAAAGGPGLNVLPSAGYNDLLQGELLQIGAGCLDWNPSGQIAGVGLAGRKSDLLANPAGEYVLHSGTIPTTGLTAGTYVAVLIPVRTRVLRPDLDFSQPQAGFVMDEAAGAGASLTFTIIAPDIPADFDDDGDVDGTDVDLFIACVTGPALIYDPQTLPQLPPGCTLTPDAQGYLEADFDSDGDVDQSDFGVLQKCFSGSAPGLPGCAD